MTKETEKSICLLERENFAGAEKFEFYNKHNTNRKSLLAIPKNLLCENSEYFKVKFD